MFIKYGMGLIKFNNFKKNQLIKKADSKNYVKSINE